jgi:hypothetical protein
MHRLDAYLTQIIADYRYFFDVLTGKFPDLRIFCHGYDWMLPRFAGIYLWPIMEEREIQEPLRASWSISSTQGCSSLRAMLPMVAGSFT